MRPGPEVAVYLCAAPVDMRRQANGLALLVEHSLQRSVFEPALFCFSNRRHDRVKVVYWERNGLRRCADGAHRAATVRTGPFCLPCAAGGSAIPAGNMKGAEPGGHRLCARQYG